MKPSWWSFGGSAAADPAELASAPAFEGDVKKPSDSAKPYPTTTTPNGYVLNDDAKAALAGFGAGLFDELLALFAGDPGAFLAEMTMDPLPVDTQIDAPLAIAVGEALEADAMFLKRLAGLQFAGVGTGEDAEFKRHICPLDADFPAS
jgi:hypothetical protein